jgi:thiol:disulfide interchange protein
MKKNLFLLTIALISTAFVCNKTFAQIKFESGTWSQIKAKAKAENKLIFLDAYTTWCGPCKWMARNVFTNDTVAQFYNATFVNAKIDMEAG